MKAGGIGVVRMAVPWSSVQEKRKAASTTGPGSTKASGSPPAAGLKVLPFLYGTPHWLAAKPTTLPVDTAKQARMEGVPERRGPTLRAGRGVLGRTRSRRRQRRRQPAPVRAGPPGVEPIRRPMPIRTWQIWNEANFFYFALPASPSRYAKLVKISSQAIKAIDPGRR